jgi:hypothetical protein
MSSSIPPVVSILMLMAFLSRGLHLVTIIPDQMVFALENFPIVPLSVLRLKDLQDHTLVMLLRRRPSPKDRHFHFRHPKTPINHLKMNPRLPE